MAAAEELRRHALAVVNHDVEGVSAGLHDRREVVVVACGDTLRLTLGFPIYKDGRGLGALEKEVYAVLFPRLGDIYRLTVPGAPFVAEESRQVCRLVAMLQGIAFMVGVGSAGQVDGLGERLSG